MVFSMNVFNNRKIKERKNPFYIYAAAAAY